MNALDFIGQFLLVSSLFFFSQMLLLLSEKYTPEVKTSFNDQYDFIIVGAGSAGSVLANRLTEKSCFTVLLLETGGSAPPWAEIPALARSFYRSDLDYGYSTVKQKHAGHCQINQEIPFSLGKGIGGSTTWGDMNILRGNRRNYDDWADKGAKGWSYEELLPYFKKLENMTVPEFMNSDYHGFSGPLVAERPGYNPELNETVFKAAVELGYPIVDSNAREQYGFFAFPCTLKNGRRYGHAKAYLVPAENRENLHIVANARVKKVVMENTTATGVEVEFGSETRIVKATKEVILSAGAIHTPQLLMLSGIGPAAQLKKHKIPLVADLPVGVGLQDHVISIYPYTISSLIPQFPVKAAFPTSAIQYFLYGTGPLTSPSAVSTLAFLTNRRNESLSKAPDYQLYFVETNIVVGALQASVNPLDFAAYYGPYLSSNVVWCLSQLQNPRSRGSVTLKSTDINDPPLVDPNYFADPQDLRDVVEGMKTCEEVFSSKAFKNLSAQPLTTSYPRCLLHKHNRDKFFACQAESSIVAPAHAIGTAKMGNLSSSDTVVDPKLRVKGIKRLRVVDASIIPVMPSGNINIPVTAVAEKAADIIKETINCQ